MVYLNPVVESVKKNTPQKNKQTNKKIGLIWFATLGLQYWFGLYPDGFELLDAKQNSKILGLQIWRKTLNWTFLEKLSEMLGDFHSPLMIINHWEKTVHPAIQTNWIIYSRQIFLLTWVQTHHAQRWKQPQDYHHRKTNQCERRADKPITHHRDLASSSLPRSLTTMIFLWQYSWRNPPRKKTQLSLWKSRGSPSLYSTYFKIS